MNEIDIHDSDSLYYSRHKRHSYCIQINVLRDTDTTIPWSKGDSHSERSSLFLSLSLSILCTDLENDSLDGRDTYGRFRINSVALRADITYTLRT